MIQFYKPNSKNTGCAASFKIGADKKSGEPLMFVNGIQQASWNDQTKTGSFTANKDNPNKTFIIKLGAHEVGEIMRVIRTVSEHEFSSYHKHGNGESAVQTSISFKPFPRKFKTKEWDAKTKQSNEVWKEKNIYSFSITKGGTQKYGLLFEAGEAEMIYEFFRKYLNLYFQFQEDKAREAFEKYNS